MEESERSKVFPNEAFGYWKVVVDRPLRLRGRLSAEAITALRTASGDADLREPLLATFGDALANDFARVAPRLGQWLDDWSPDDAPAGDDDDTPARGVPVARRRKLLDGRTWERDHRLVQAATALRARLGDAVDGFPAVIEIPHDHDLRTTDQLPLPEEGANVSSLDH